MPEFDLDEPVFNHPHEPHLYWDERSSRAYVVMPEKGPVTAAALVNKEYAWRLGRQLTALAELLYNIETEARAKGFEHARRALARPGAHGSGPSGSGQ